jgi:hypothetical protein
VAGAGLAPQHGTGPCVEDAEEDVLDATGSDRSVAQHPRRSSLEVGVAVDRTAGDRVRFPLSDLVVSGEAVLALEGLRVSWMVRGTARTELFAFWQAFA